VRESDFTSMGLVPCPTPPNGEIADRGNEQLSSFAPNQLGGFVMHSLHEAALTALACLSGE
jgi:hypothetical protein